jgi:hypothetical protein
MAGEHPTDRLRTGVCQLPACTLLNLLFLLYVFTVETAQPTCAHDSSNDSGLVEYSAFGGRIYIKFHSEVKTFPELNVFVSDVIRRNLVLRCYCPPSGDSSTSL